jgi:hypothetical protein
MSSFNKTVTDKQLAANRANAQLSTGPQSPEAKEKVAQNAAKHYMTAAFRVLSWESQEDFDDLLKQFIEDEKPVGIAEVQLVRRMVEYTWLIGRARLLHEGCFSVKPQTQEQADDYQYSIDLRYNELDKILRYQAHFERCYARCSAELLKRKKERRLEENGIVSQKRAEAEEGRRAERHTQGNEMFKVRHATAESNRDYAETRKATAKVKHELVQIQLFKQFDPKDLEQIAKMVA